MKWITRILPLLFLGMPAHAEPLPVPDVRLIDVRAVWPEGGLRLELQVRPQKNVQLTGEVEVAGPLTLTDDEGRSLETPAVKVLDSNRPVDKILTLTCKDMPECNWFRLGGSLRITQGGDVRQGAWHTCPTGKECRFTEGGIAFTVNAEEDRALAERVWNERTPRIHPKGMVWISCNAADANRIERWEITGRKWMHLGHVHRETRQAEGRFIWVMGYDSVQREVKLSPQLFGSVQTVEIPEDCICGITGQTKAPSPMPPAATTMGPCIRMERFAWNDDDHPGMMGMIVPMDPLSLTFSVYDEQGERIAPFVGQADGDKIRVTDATGRRIPCQIRSAGGLISLDFQDALPEGTWLKLEGAISVSIAKNAAVYQPGPITLKGPMEVTVGGLPFQIKEAQVDGKRYIRVTLPEGRMNWIKLVRIDGLHHTLHYADGCVGYDFELPADAPEHPAISPHIEVHTEPEPLEIPLDGIYTLRGRSRALSWHPANPHARRLRK